MQNRNNPIYSFDAIGTTWWLERLDGSDWTDFEKRMIAEEVSLFDERYSRFKKTSLVSKLYETSEMKEPPQEFVEMLEFARTARSNTDGAFDITVGSDLHELGYGKRHKAVRFDRENFWQNIQVKRSAVAIPHPVMLDLGGFGKGWLIDSLKQLLLQNGIRLFIINGGGDMFVSSDKKIEIALADPAKNSTVAATVKLSEGAIAVSGTTLRVWEFNNESHHHIIDPTTHLSSNSNARHSVVIAGSAAVADMIATAIIVRPELVDKLEQLYDAKIIALS